MDIPLGAVMSQIVKTLKYSANLPSIITYQNPRQDLTSLFPAAVLPAARWRADTPWLGENGSNAPDLLVDLSVRATCESEMDPFCLRSWDYINGGS